MDIIEKVARRLHYIDWLYRQLPIRTEWDDLTQSGRNQYRKFARQLVNIANGKEPMGK